MKKYLLCLTAGCIAAPASAQTFSIKPLIDVRVRYENVDQDGFAREADAFTLRARAGAEVKSGAFSFLVEGESAHMPVALASMVAKFIRELAMLRFNQHWGRVRMAALGQEIKPTAGYRNDAHRWLEEIGEVMTPDDRRQLVRLA